MKYLSEKGQAFSVFKLLIAGVVAVVILAILMQIIGQLVFTQTDVNEQVTRKLKTQTNNLGSPGVIKKVSFTSENAVLDNRTIALASDVITPDQVCVSLGYYKGREDSGFQEIVAGKKLQYSGSGTRNVNIIIFCDSAEEIADSLGEYENASGSVKMSADWLTECKTAGTLDETSTAVYCLIALKEASAT